MDFSFDRAFIRFVLIGILNTIFGVGLYCFFIYLGISYSVAVLFSTVLGVLFNFKTIGVFVFKNGDNRLIFRFLTVYSALYFVNIALIHLFIKLIELNEYIAGIVVTPIVAIVSFILQKHFVFKKY